MNDMHNLLLKVDSLTYNAMQVLNALIRSAVASGSSSGYKVTKYGNELVLTRSDIYKLNNFYELWEAEGFPSDETTFNRMLAEADARWRKAGENTTLATDAVVKHSQILFMTERDSNKVGDGDTAYWTDKVRTSGTPKATVGTAPIPINLRTPLYDENLSTKSFSQYETYLFPMGYRRAEILGTPGNGDDYLAGGANWTIDASDFLTLKGNHILLGDIALPQNRLDNFGDSVNTVSGGLNSYGLRDYSLAFGVNSAAVAEKAIVFGEDCIGYGVGSFVAGGYLADTIGTHSFATNDSTRATGGASFAANHSTSAGSWHYSFTLPDTAEQTEAPCPETITDDKCYVPNSNVATTLTNYKVIRVSQDDVKYSAIVDEKGKPVLDIKVGDRVIIYGTTYKAGTAGNVGAAGLDGYGRDAFDVIVTAIEEVVNNGQTVAYDITLDKPIPVDDIKYSPITGGYVTVMQRDIKEYDYLNHVSGIRTLFPGNRSASFGESTLARGECQAVFGEMNVPNDYARMVVGVGSYISDNNHSRYRANGLLIGDYYSYMKLREGTSVVGVSSGTYAAQDAEQTALAEGAFLKSSYVGFGETLVVSTGRLGVIDVKDSDRNVLGRVAVTNHPVLLGTSQFVTAEMSAYRGCAVISSGSYISGDVNAGELVDTLITDSPVIGGPDEHGIAIYAQDGIDIRNTANSSERGINIETCSYLALTFKELAMHGNTYGTLTASDSARSFILKGRPGDGNGKTGQQDDILYAHTVGRSGFYGGLVGSNFNVYGSSGWSGLAAHIISSAFYDDTIKKIQVASIGIPSKPTSTVGVARPVVTVGTITHPGNDNQVGDVYTKELAYLDDANGWCMSPMAGFGYLFVNGNTPPSDTMVPPSTSYRTVYPVSAYNTSTNRWDDEFLYAEVTPINPSLDPLFTELYLTHALSYKIKHEDTAVYEYLMTFSLTGNHLDLTLHAEVQMETADLRTLIGSYNMIRVPALIGCAIRSIDNMPGAVSWKYSMEPPELVTSPRPPISTWISGSSYYAGKPAEYRFSAQALENGIIVMNVMPISTWNGGFYAQFSGAVPFEADNRCRHGKVNDAWRLAMHDAYSGKIVMSYNDLRDFLNRTMV